MPVKHPLLLSVLMLGASTIVLHSQGVGASSEAPAPAALFGAPPAPAADATPASILGTPRPVDGSRVGEVQPAAAKPASTPWILNRPKPQAASADSYTATPNAGPAIDLSPLRYYAQQNDMARVAAEIRLLRAKHPGWEPPEDLFSDLKSSEPEQPLWDLFAKHDLDGLQAAMDERRQRTPGWRPSSDLANKLALTLAYDSLVKASDAKDWGTVIDVASTNRGLMTCGNVDAMWRTAEALELSDDEAHAVEAYRYILSSCPKPEERLATLQKASALVKSPESLDALIQMGKRLPSGRSEFDQVRLDLVRQKVGNAAAGKAGPAPTQAELDSLSVNAETAAGRSDAELLGWYAYARKDNAQAETWFRKSLQAGPYPKGAEGLVLALRDRGKKSEAERLALQYAALDPLNRKLMVEVLAGSLNDPDAVPLSADELTVLATGIDAERSAVAAQSFGWLRYKSGDLAGAEMWFRKSAAWAPSESAAVGLMVSAKRLKHESDYASVVAQYRGTYPKIAELERLMKSSPQAKRSRPTRVARGGATHSEGGWDQGATAIVNTFQNGNTEQTMAMLDQRKAQRHGEPNGLSVVRGWALYKRGDWEGAKAVFQDLNTKGMTAQAQDGLREINLGYSNPRYR